MTKSGISDLFFTPNFAWVNMGGGGDYKLTEKLSKVKKLANMSKKPKKFIKVSSLKK